MSNLYRRIKELLQKDKRPIVFVCGLGGAGKTTFAKKIASEAEIESIAIHSDWWAKYATIERKKRIKAAFDSGDSDYIEREENPINWYDWEGMKNDLLKLQRIGSLELADAWNQETGGKGLAMNLSLPNKGLIIFDGIYLLHPEIAEIADLIVLLDVSVETCRKRSDLKDGHRNSPEYLRYKAALAKKYDIPYFEKFKDNADLFSPNYA